MGSSNLSSTFSLPDLPNDLFVMVLEGLDAWDVVRCQKVSTRWREAFLQPEYLRIVVRKYPNSREARHVLDCNANTNWRKLFDPVASRYYHLSAGKARELVRYRLNPLDQYGLWYPIGQWEYHESQPGGRLYYENAATHLSRVGTKPYLFRSTLWSYDNGLVACAPYQPSMGKSDENNVLSILDISNAKYHTVPFNCHRKVIRNISLRNRALVVEWAEKEPYHDLNDSEKVHRHFATCYDVIPVETTSGPAWQVTLRNEWKMHFLGMPINSRDRFFSTHNGTHYAVYFWQPNRSMYTGDEDMPLEALFVWDITTTSTYRPSADPTGGQLPGEDERPHILARYGFRELDFIGVRQHSNISLLSMSLDSHTHSLTIRENVCVAGQGYFDPAERLMQADTTIFPFLGEGPAWRRSWHGELPPYRGHCSMESTDVEVSEKWFQPVMDVFDPIADVRFSLIETCFTGQMENRLLVRMKSLDRWATLEDKTVGQVAAMGRIAGDERWMVGQNGQMDLVIVKF